MATIQTIPLLDEYPVLVVPTLAVRLGLNAAIVVQQIHYWLEHNKREGKKKAQTHFFENRWWVYNTYAEWQEDNFPWWSHATIRRIFGGLRERGVIECREADKRNDGLWVTINYETLYKSLGVGSAQNEQTDSQGSDQDEQTPAQDEQDLGDTETNAETTSPSGASKPHTPMPAAGNPDVATILRNRGVAGEAEGEEKKAERKGKPSQHEDFNLHGLGILINRAFGFDRLPATVVHELDLQAYTINISDGKPKEAGYLTDFYTSVPGFSTFAEKALGYLLKIESGESPTKKAVNAVKYLRNFDKKGGKLPHWNAWREANPTLCSANGTNRASEPETRYFTPKQPAEG